MGDLSTEGLGMTLWALSKGKSLKGAWNLFDHMKDSGVSVDLLCSESLLMECEQRRLLEQEFALLKRLESTEENHGAVMGLRAATERIATRRMKKPRDSDGSEHAPF